MGDGLDIHSAGSRRPRHGVQEVGKDVGIGGDDMAGLDLQGGTRAIGASSPGLLDQQLADC